MRQRVLGSLSRAIVARPGAVVLAGALLTAASLWMARDLPLHASRMDYLSPQDPTSQHYQDFVDHFAPLNSVYVVLEGDTAERRLFATEAAEALREMQHVRTVIHRLDVKRYRALGLYLKSEAELEATSRDLVDALPVLRETAREPTLARFLESAAAEMADEDRPAPPVADARRSVAAIGATVRTLVGTLSGAGDGVPVLPGFSVRQDGFKRLHVDDEGYFVSDDGGAGMLILWPAISMSRDVSIRPFLADLESRLAPIRARHALVRVSMAGGPVRDLEEHQTVNRDLAVTSAISGVAVFLLLRLGYSAWGPAVLLMLVLTQCIAFTLLAVRLVVGHLTLLSSVCIAILFGLGDDFGSYLILRVDELRAAGERDAIGRATAEVGASVLTGAISMAAAFFSLCLHDLPAFAQLGIIVGLGVVITYVSMITLLPAYLCLRYTWSGAPRPGRSEGRVRWLSRAIVAASRWPRLVLTIAAAATALMLVSLPKNRFEYDLARLLPEGGAASRAQEMVKTRFGMSPDFNVVVSRTLDEARAVCEALRTAPTVSRLDSLALLIPEGVARKAPLVARIAAIARRLPAIARAVPGADVPALEGALASMQTALARPLALARMNQSAELVSDVEACAGELHRARALLRARAAAAPAEVVAALRALDARVGQELSALFQLLGDATTAQPYSISTLPDEWKLRFVGKDGRIATYVLPAVDLSLEAGARAFHDDTVRVAPAATGVPVIVYRSMTAVQRGWRRASIYVLVAVCAVVLLDFSRRGFALLALLPLVLGLFWMHAALTFAGVTWNALSMLAIPIVLGVGVDYGVHLLHRYQADGDLDRTLGSGGRAIAYAALTTAVGFGSLAFARHRGLSSFGLAAFTGTSGCVVAALFVVPALLRLHDSATGASPVK